MPHSIVDIHTHNRPINPSTAIVHLSPWEHIPPEGWYSLGIHPWSLTSSGIVCCIPRPATGSHTMPGTEEMSMKTGKFDDSSLFLPQDEALLTMARSPQVLVIGEAGIDHFCSAPMQQQFALFSNQARLAERVGKPLIVHMVRSASEILFLKKQLRPTMPWIVHGFRGGQALARQLVDHGLYLSFGTHYRPEAISITPKNRLFIETDDSISPVVELYQSVAEVLGISTHVLLFTVADNIERTFFCGR